MNSEEMKARLGKLLVFSGCDLACLECSYREPSSSEAVIRGEAPINKMSVIVEGRVTVQENFGNTGNTIRLIGIFDTGEVFGEIEFLKMLGTKDINNPFEATASVVPYGASCKVIDITYKSLLTFVSQYPDFVGRLTNFILKRFEEQNRYFCQMVAATSLMPRLCVLIRTLKGETEQSEFRFEEGFHEIADRVYLLENSVRAGMLRNKKALENEYGLTFSMSGKVVTIAIANWNLVKEGRFKRG